MAYGNGDGTDTDYDQLALLDPTIDDDFGSGPVNPRRSLMRRLQLQAAQELTRNPDPQYAEYEPTNADQPQYARGNGPGIGTDNGTQGGGGGDGPPATETDEMNGLSAEGPYPPPPPAADDDSDSLNLPTDMPAAGARTAAASRLQRARGAITGEGMTGKQVAVQSVLQALPALIGGFHGESAVGAAEGANEAAQMGLKRKYQDISNAQGDYQFEAGREERERELAIKQKLAESQLSATKAYRTLMASISGKKAQTGANNSVVNALGKGLVLRTKDDGTTEVVPATPDQMSAIQNARLGVAQAETNLKSAQAKAVPEQIEIAKKRLDIQRGMLQRSLAALQVAQANQQRNDAQFELNNGITSRGEQSDLIDQVPNAPTDAQGNAVPYKPAAMMGPSGQEKSRAGAAVSTQKLFRKLAAEVIKSKSRLGPIMGRVSMAQLLAGDVPPELSKIAALTGQAYAVATTAHGWRSAEAPAKFEQSIGYMSRDPDSWAAGLLEAADDMDTLIEPGTTVKSAGAGGAGAAGAAARLKKRASGSSADNSDDTSATPPRPSHVPQNYVWKKGSRGYGWYKPGVN